MEDGHEDQDDAAVDKVARTLCGRGWVGRLVGVGGLGVEDCGWGDDGCGGASSLQTETIAKKSKAKRQQPAAQPRSTHDNDGDQQAPPTHAPAARTLALPAGPSCRAVLDRTATAQPLSWKPWGTVVGGDDD